MNEYLGRDYTNEELERLHVLLLDILKEIVRVCDILHLKYFIIGGTAIGAYFWKGIIPWDDDIDIGMIRKDYERFLHEAPSVLKAGYTLQHFYTEPNTPFYYAKVRKDDTLFVEESYRDLNIHHGVFIDIFPFDRIPRSGALEKVQRRIVQYFEGSFRRRLMKRFISEGMAKLPYFVRKPLTDFRFALIRLIPRKYFYWRMTLAQTWFNKKDCEYVNVIKMPLDQIPVKDIDNSRQVEFGGMMVNAPDNMEDYLKHHYPNLNKFPPEEARINHRPIELSFNE